MQRQDVKAALQSEGYDEATAETISELAASKPHKEAKALLSGMLGSEHPVVKRMTPNQKVAEVRELTAAIEKLSLPESERAECDCMGSVHGLLEIAPNCLQCGRIVCNSEGFGPCKFCNAPLLPTDQIEKLRAALNAQRDELVAGLSKRALQELKIDPKSIMRSSKDADARLERLLNYQAEDAQRTRIIDRAGEADPPGGKWDSVKVRTK